MVLKSSVQGFTFEDGVPASTRTIDLNTRTTVSNRPVEPGFVAPSDSILTVKSEVPQSTETEYKNSSPGFLDVRQFKDIFSDVRNPMMYDRRGVCRDTDIGE